MGREMIEVDMDTNYFSIQKQGVVCIIFFLLYSLIITLLQLEFNIAVTLL